MCRSNRVTRSFRPIIELPDRHAPLGVGRSRCGGAPLPFTRKRTLDEPKVIVIDPRLSFGRPVLAGTCIPTAIIAERYKAGESVDDLADDYGRKRLEIEEAIRCELAERAA